VSTSEDLPARHAASPGPGAGVPTAPLTGRSQPRSWIDAEAPPHPTLTAADDASAGASPDAAPDSTQDSPATAPERSAFLTVARVDPWSVMKLSFLVSVALAIIVVVAVFVLWQVLDGMGVFDSVSRIVDQITRGEAGGGIQIEDYVGLRRVMTYAVLLSAVNVVLITALATLGAFLYNACVRLVGGLQVTLTESI
jgi:hypothetical protein